MYGDTDIGRIRAKNQDSYFFNELQGLAIVADGIGGRPGGEVASQLAVEAVRNAFVQCDSLRAEEVSHFLVTAIDQANSEIIKRGQKKESISGMGTTINVLLFVGENLYIAHVGDSRTYLQTSDHIWQMTVDHNIEVYVEKGWFPPEVLKNNSKPGALVRALGLSARCEADVYEKQIKVGEVFLTCSDGLTGMVSNRKINDIIRQNRDRLEAAPKILIAEANRNGGKDNTTVVISEVVED
jgi:serine/threonine protein phosphatase PrpC